MFEGANGDFDIQKKHINDKGEYVITAGLTNNGILGRTNIKAKIFNERTITVDMFGNAFYRQFKYKMVTHARVFSLVPKFFITDNQGLFLASSFRYINRQFGYENMCSWEKIKTFTIQLPIKDNEIDFNFMESFVAELEEERVAELEEERVAELEEERVAELSAYLIVSGLDNYELSEDEEKVLNDVKLDIVKWGEYKYKDIFNRIEQGQRLKKGDQMKGNIPFVMSGTTNTGVVNFISNPVASFPANSITVDIFGNAFYRGYAFGAGDDTGVYWNDKIEYVSNTMLFFTAAIQKSLAGKYSYGKKLRSSRNTNFLMSLPSKNGKPDYETMETLISAVQKLVIKDVVLYTDKRIKAAKKIIK